MKVTSKASAVAVPNVVGNTVAVGRVALVAAGFVVEAGNVGEDFIIASQSPLAASMAKRGSTVTLTATPPLTLSQRNAIAKAKNYLSFTAFSRSGLIEQLKFEGFNDADATFGADQVGADWNAQAVAKAKSYLSFTSFSHSGLVEQLEFEGFTAEQAEYGVTQVGL